MLEIKKLGSNGWCYSVSKGLWIQWQSELCNTLEKTLNYKHGVKKVHVMRQTMSGTQRGWAGAQTTTLTALLENQQSLLIDNRIMCPVTKLLNFYTLNSIISNFKTFPNQNW